MRKVFSGIIILLVLLPPFTTAQSIRGIINSYYKVEAVNSTYLQMPAGSDLSGLKPGDKVLLIQMTGTNVTPGGSFPNEQSLTYSNFVNTGHSVLLAVGSVNDGTDRIYPTVSVNASDFTNTEKIQLVKIFEADYASVDSTVTAANWDGEKGGVLAMVIFKKLTLNANIDVSGKGFRGALPEPDYAGGCNSEASYYYITGTTDKAGRKGEGCVTTSWTYHVGAGRIVTGGGGGHGWFGGGGGGGHVKTIGISGGHQYEVCTPSRQAMGGCGLTNFYAQPNNFRVSMGGGGGSSTETDEYSATRGGNGGGIVILLADTLDGNDRIISSMGESVTEVSEAGAGGGGAGGSILLDINHFTGNLGLTVRGGNGGNSGSEINTGAGGGGGGGVIWHAGTKSLFPAWITLDTVGGIRGFSGATALNGRTGETGTYLAGLKLPLNGFLFNALVAPDTVCAGTKPGVIKASMPKGGSSGYTYEWYQKREGQDWQIAAGTGDSLNFYPDKLVETTYFTRVVKSGPVTDTARKIEIFVFDSIENNVLGIRDTLCYGNTPGTLTGGVPSGADGEFNYVWQSKTEAGTWQNRVFTPSLAENPLMVSHSYRRIVTSARVCADTSNIDTITVLNSIVSNILARTDTAICFGLNAGSVKLSQPGGGDGIYRYSWMQSDNNVSFSEVSGAHNPSYAPGVLNSTNYFKRIVFSGSGDACSDTSASFPILVYPSITDNFVSTDSSRYCAGSTIGILAGVLPGGGAGSGYVYRWLNRLPEGNWSVIPSQTGVNYSPAGIFEDTTQIRRLVISGNYNACIDSGNIVQIDVIPYIVNELITPDSAVCEGATPLPFNELPASGGAGAYTYLWEFTPAGNILWQPAAGINNTPSYTPMALTESMLFRRVVGSEICTDYSDPVIMEAYPLLSNNRIGGNIQYTCFNTSRTINGSTPQGGDPDGAYRYLWQQSAEMTNWDVAPGNGSSVSYATPVLNDTSYFRRIVMSGDHNQCTDTSDAALIRINRLPSGDIISGIDTACAGSSITVYYHNLQGPSPWTLHLGDDDQIQQPVELVEDSGEFSFTVYESGHLRLWRLMDDSTCLADLTSNTGVIDLTVFEVPEAFAGNDTGVCGLECILAALPSVGLGFWSEENSVFSNITYASSGVTSGTYGSVTYTWSEVNWQCSDEDQVEITFYEQPPVPDLGENILLDYTFEYQLSAPLQIGEGFWECVGREVQFDDPVLYNAMVTFNYPATGDYIMKWTNTNGVCDAVSDTMIITIGEIQRFTGFSPNGDGVNDQFILKLSGRELSVLKIFDRWGNKIAELTGFDEIVWDPKNEFPAGTYFYILEQPGVPYLIQDYVELRR